MIDETDELLLNDMVQAEKALLEAKQALTRAMCGVREQSERERRFHHLGLSYGLLHKAIERVEETGVKK
jgi:hypothetical protein